ncbi:hypothetical protein GCM10020295_01660 [Streptomyces cinereospinus]
MAVARPPRAGHRRPGPEPSRGRRRPRVADGRVPIRCGRPATPAVCRRSGSCRATGLAKSLKYGFATASPVAGKASPSSRRHAVPAALSEYPAIRRTIHAAKYLSDESCHRGIARQVNKGESLHSLQHQLRCAREGKVARRRPEQRTEQAWCLTVVANAVICRRAEYIGPAVDELRRADREVDAEGLAHVSPARSSAATPAAPSPSTTSASSPSWTSRSTDRSYRAH